MPTSLTALNQFFESCFRRIKGEEEEKGEEEKEEDEEEGQEEEEKVGLGNICLTHRLTDKYRTYLNHTSISPRLTQSNPNFEI